MCDEQKLNVIIFALFISLGNYINVAWVMDGIGSIRVPSVVSNDNEIMAHVRPPRRQDHRIHSIGIW